MKKFFTVLFIITILISGCSPASPTITFESVPTSPATRIPSVEAATETATEIPPTPTFTPTPTVSLPVSQLTPVPSSNTKITAENVKDLQEIAKYYSNVDYFAKITKDKEFMFILDTDRLTKYNYNSMEEIATIQLASYLAFIRGYAGLQVSNDGKWLIANNEWLIDLRDDNNPIIYSLFEAIDLLNYYRKTFVLSPDGSMIAIEQVQCKDLCDHLFQILSIEDFKVLYTSSAPTYQSLPTFSSDGKYFALVDLTQVATSGGGTSVAGGTVGIWAVNDFTKILSLPVKSPFSVSDVAFSDDGSVLAVAQRFSVDFYDSLSGTIKASISDLCDSYERKVRFVPASTTKGIEKSDCSSGVWNISGSTAIVSNQELPDFAKITFDEGGKIKTIPYPQPMVGDFKPFRSQSYFYFANNDVISFKNLDAQTLDNHSCDLSLADGLLSCQSHNRGDDRILSTDGKYYTYRVEDDKVNIYSSDNRNIIFYSMPFYKYSFELLALDTINNIVFYINYLNPNESSIVVEDMETNKILEKWDGDVRYNSASSASFSKNTKLAAFCRAIMLRNGNVFNQDFMCATPAILLNNGSKLVVRDSDNNGLTIFSGEPANERNHIEIANLGMGQALSPDGTLLVSTCDESDICFFDTVTTNKLYQIKAYSNIANLAFSPDGSLLATSSNWGLISLWAVPPFDFNPVREQVSSTSVNDSITSWEFNQDGNLEGWGEQDWQYGDLTNPIVQDGSLTVKTTGNDPQIYSNESLDIDISKYTRIEIRMRVSNGDSAQLFFRNENNDMSEDKSIIFPIESGTEFKTYHLDMSKVTSWKDIIYQLRLDPTYDVTGATINIDYIRLLP